ncbi:MAG: AraC family transcriptional regulator [Spirochaetales bacterium]|nr:AraC family transcriptional regulator [Spirochaetales bacterium]
MSDIDKIKNYGLMRILPDAKHTDFRPEGLSGWTILFTTKGAASFGLDESFSLVPQRIVVIPPDLQHYYKLNKATGWIHYWAVIDKSDRLASLFASLECGRVSLLEMAPGFYREIKYYFRQLMRLDSSQHVFSMKKSNLLENIILSIVSAIDTTMLVTGDARIDQTIFFLKNADLSSCINSSELAYRVCLSESRFIHLFTSVMGVSPQNYIEQLACQRAEQLLAARIVVPKQLPALFGYSDYRYFSKVFKKYYGMTPLEYLK